ncbi:MAG: Bifunctional protein GlmU [Pseudomonadota bacterium]
MSTSAILLAAGSGSRMGYLPKCLISVNGQILLRRTLRALSLPQIDEVVLLTGHHAQLIHPHLAEFTLKLVHNRAPQESLTSSLRLGLAAVTGDTVVVALADQPLLSPQDIGDLLLAWQHRPLTQELLYPSVHGSRGNPVVFSRSVVQEVLASHDHFGVRQWQEQHPSKVCVWSSTNTHYTTDLDSPEDLDKLRLLGHELVLPRL